MKQVNPLIVKTAEELNQKPCKFKVGDIVNTKPNLYGETEGVVTSVKRIYALFLMQLKYCIFLLINKLLNYLIF